MRCAARPAPRGEAGRFRGGRWGREAGWLPQGPVPGGKPSSPVLPLAVGSAARPAGSRGARRQCRRQGQACWVGEAEGANREGSREWQCPRVGPRKGQDFHAAGKGVARVLEGDIIKNGLEDVVAIMIPEPKGKEIVSLLERNITVMMYITIGTRNLQKYVSRTSVVFVSISFIVLMIISLAWLVFYYIQRFRYANARDRNQRRLGDAAKKAISKLQVRTIRKGDKETEPDFDNCAVCIEGYKPNDVVRILPCRHLFHKSCVDPWLLDHRTCPMCKMNILKALGIPPNADCMDDIPPDLEASIGGPPTNQITGASDITVNESSVALDPPVRTVGVLQVIQDVDSFPQIGEGNFTTSNEQEPAVSSDSDISLIMAMEVGLSDVELSTDQDCEEVKS
ncbi:RING finger protein 150 isoform X2 [Grus americana]|uniref:RING finger protein 150 isoform X2 n=1 Tax=Grus americana TaxID=9117 RepID=UPI0024086AD3|nr:RING finger protein 150 isoform X2 [Grus americana]